MELAGVILLLHELLHHLNVRPAVRPVGGGFFFLNLLKPFLNQLKPFLNLFKPLQT